jgi:L-lactate dehydrogenase (cytochrome)
VHILKGESWAVTNSGATKRFAFYKQIFRFKKPDLNRKRRRLKAANTIYDLRVLARKRTPRSAFDYTDGGADAELSLRRNRQAYEEIEFLPRVLKDVTKIQLETKMLGKISTLPFGIAPTGFTRMMHSNGEQAGSQAAEARGIPFTLSTMGTTSIEEVARLAPSGRNWFQLYIWKDRDRSTTLINRAEAAGFDTLVVTVDAQVAGNRLRDVRNGLTVPPTLTAKSLVDAIPRISWWWDLLTKEPLEFASLLSWQGTVAELMNTMFDPSVTFNDFEWLRNEWGGKLVIKGVQTVEDARLSVKAGADAVILSNHGGRQLDRSPVPLHLVRETVKEIGKDAEVHVDSGIMHGSDIITAIALGAKFTWVGRAYLYGLMAGGREGVERALDILESQMQRTMKLIGVNSLEELTPDVIKFL